MSFSNQGAGSADATPTEGDVLGGRYQLESPIGRGGTATVWAAHDLNGDQDVAVKIVHMDSRRAAAFSRKFEREVANATAVSHPNSVRVIGHGRIGNEGFFLVMERLHGLTLAEVLRRDGCLPLQRAISIFHQILDCIGCAHQRRIVHRDLKPSNVMIIAGPERTETVKICDFGLSRAFYPDEGPLEATDRETPSETERFCGTPQYMSPEQARGEHLDARSDLYSISAMLFEALVGRPPFVAPSTLGIVSLQLSASPPRPSAIRRDLELPPALENLVLRGLAKSPLERPSSAEVYCAELLQIARDETRRLRSAQTQNHVDDSPTLDAEEHAPPSRRAQLSWWHVAAIAAAASVAAGGIALFAPSWKSAHTRNLAPPHMSPSVLHLTRSAEPTTAILPPGAHSSLLAQRAPINNTESLAKPRRGRRQHSGGRRSPLAPRSGETPLQANPHSPAPAPFDSHALLASAEVSLSRGLIGEACALGEAVVRSHPDLAAGHKFLGRCFVRLGSIARARVHYRRYLTLEPDAEDKEFVEAILSPWPH